ncbi:MAG: hypothetical protein ACRD2Y_10095, partial [Terriglobales bacterium]
MNAGKRPALLAVGLAITAALAQVGCSKDAGPAQDPASSDKPAAHQPAKTRARTVTVPEGTPLSVRTTAALSTNSNEAGQTFVAHLE